MQRCITTAGYTHICDVYSKQVEYDESSGSMEWTWSIVEENVPCMVRPFVDGGIKGNGTMEKFDTDAYISTDYVRIKTRKALTKSQRVTNIRSAQTGNVIWAEEELDEGPTIFNVDGSAPVPNPLTGDIQEFISVLSRAQSQGME